MLIKLLYLIFLEPIVRCFIGIFKRKKERDFTGDIVLVTGAAQGLGKAIALQFADRGCVLVLWDINESKLLETCSELTSQGHEAFAYVVDCSKKEEIYKAAQRVKEEVGNVSVLVNNAGILNGKLIVDLEDEKIQQLIDINFLSHYWTIKSFLPWMMRNDYGAIVSISSITSFSGCPFISDYCTAKSAVSSLCESLTMELMVAGKFGISVTCAHPGNIRDTGLRDGHEHLIESLQFQLPSMTSNYAAKRIIEGVSNRQNSLIIPQYYIIVLYLKLFLPEKARLFIMKQGIKRLFKKPPQ